MKPLIVITVTMLLLVGVAFGATQKEHPTGFKTEEVTKKTATKKATRAVRAVQPIVLPNIRSLVKKAWNADHKTLVGQQKKSATVLAFFHGRGKWLMATRHEKCWEVPWQRSCTVARAVYRLHTSLGRVVTRRLMYEIPATNDWVTAVRLVQRISPGTESFLLNCSSGEGGHGGFVMNHQGSGASGWMQFLSGTFYGHAPEALAHAQSMGFILPDGLLDIHSPLGQAITAAYMRTHGMSSHWDPSIDSLCA